MESKKYIGLDVHQASISAAVRDDVGKLVMECVIETKAGTIMEFIRGVRGNLCVTFEEGTSAAWLYDLVKPHVAQAVVCDPQKNALLKVGNKNDRVDARKLSEYCSSQAFFDVRSRLASVFCFSRLRKAMPCWNLCLM
jgi:hypothetical protein